MANEVHLIVGAATDVGRERQVNEDSHGFLRSAAGDLLVVCDGMGGHAAGDLASRTALDAIAAFVGSQGHLPPPALLTQAALAAHEAVRAVAGTSQANAGMGTTCVMALVRSNQAWVCNVGDSRCYLVRGGGLRQLSVDHTKARKLLDAGIISQEQFVNHPEKGVLAQALGQRNPPEPYVTDAVLLSVDDYLVLCSDGVYDSTEIDMASLTAGANPNYGAHDLVAAAVKRDGKDNATVVIGRYVDLDRRVAPAGVAV
ncbi:MAG: PP2C family protein-serine/threonine phosphatase, partial [Myxococcota bacterium]